MTTTERAIARTYYRLVYETKTMKLKDVPAIYKPLLEEYRKELAGK